MAAERTKKKNTLWNFLDNLEGDKVVWMIVLLLMLISIVAIFSSTSQLALQKGTTRVSILKGQMMTIVGGLAVILVCYSIKSLRFFRFFSQFGYLVSIVLLMVQLLKRDTPHIWHPSSMMLLITTPVLMMRT